VAQALQLAALRLAWTRADIRGDMFRHPALEEQILVVGLGQAGHARRAAERLDRRRI
jgi:hypothetical protein